MIILLIITLMQHYLTQWKITSSVYTERQVLCIDTTLKHSTLTVITHRQTRARAHTHTHTHTRARAHAHTHASPPPYTHTHTHARMHTHTHICTYARTHVRTHARAHREREGVGAEQLQKQQQQYGRASLTVVLCSTKRWTLGLNEDHCADQNQTPSPGL